MEFAPEGSLQTLLKERMRSRKWLETREGVDLIQGILAGLGAAHEKEGGSIIHRDLKPANIMLSGMQPKLADFGIAAVGPVARMKTRGGQRPRHVGSSYFMSPEQLDGGDLDHRSEPVQRWTDRFLAPGRPASLLRRSLLFDYQEMVQEGIRPVPQLQAGIRTVKAFQGWLAACFNSGQKTALPRRAKPAWSSKSVKPNGPAHFGNSPGTGGADTARRRDDQGGLSLPGEVVEAVSSVENKVTTRKREAIRTGSL